MRFGEALAHARNGKKIARRGWNGKNMYVYIKPGRLIPLEKWQAMMPSEEPTEEEKKKRIRRRSPSPRHDERAW